MTGASSLKKEYTSGIMQVYAFSLLVLTLIILFLGTPYILIWKKSVMNFAGLFFVKFKNNWDSVFFYIDILKDIFFASLLIIAGALMHELIHALSWVAFTKKGIKSFKFGFSKTDFSPYIHCTEPLKISVYRIGTIMPGIILGLVPVILSLFTGKTMMFLFGVFFLWAASGDFMVLWLIRKLDKNLLVQDHPEKIGCMVIS